MSMGGIWSFLLFVLGVYVVLGAFLYFTQSRLLYYPNLPSRAVVATPARIGLAYEEVALVTEDGVRLHGWFLPSGEDRRGVLLFFHGNAGNISHRLDSLRIFHDLGLAVLIFDYRGYGQSEGKVSEQGTYRDAEAAWRHLTAARGVPENEIVLFGRSLGAAVAAHLATRHRPRALVMESSFTSVPDLAAKYYRIFPVRWLSRFRYDARADLGSLRCPVLIVHSRDDEIIPASHGRALYEAAQAPKAFLELSGGHNDGFLVSGRSYTEGLDAFLAKHLDAPGP
jgi:fermentation-respiration switch protein FrsA (DUF1100 family)